MPSLAEALNARLEGQGSSTLILSHGFGTNQSAWARIVPALHDKYRILLFDLACSGAADPNLFNILRHSGVTGYVDDLLDLLRELRIGRCTFVGHSFSGIIGLLAAIRNPGQFEQLVMIGSSPCYLNESGYHGGMTHEALLDVFASITSAYREWSKRFALIATGRKIDHPITEEFIDSMLAMRPDIALASAKAILLSDVRVKVAECPVPTVILQSRNDSMVPAEVAEFMHRNISDSRLEYLDTIGHLPHCSDPDLVVSALRRHLKEFATTSASD